MLTMGHWWNAGTFFVAEENTLINAEKVRRYITIVKYQQVRDGVYAGLFESLYSSRSTLWKLRFFASGSDMRSSVVILTRREAAIHWYGREVYSMIFITTHSTQNCSLLMRAFEDAIRQFDSKVSS